VTGARVGAVVLNYNGGERTLACLRSVLATEGDVPLRVVLVDNASTDGIAARVRAELSSVTVVESPTNRGFAGGCNLGIRAAPDAEFVALVNNDATVDPGSRSRRRTPTAASSGSRRPRRSAPAPPRARTTPTSTWTESRPGTTCRSAAPPASS